MSMQQDFETQGYVLHKTWCASQQVQALKSLLDAFFRRWVLHNKDFYQTNAVNAANLTDNKFLSVQERHLLFEFLARPQLVELVTGLLGERAVFINTQLFFNPFNPAQKNYWHRDHQYHLHLEQQKAALSGPEVLHFRLVLADEPGIELVPGSHKSWDTDEELAVRLEQGTAKRWHGLSTGVELPLQTGDLLVFSANMLHRGLYGQKRFAFDMLFAEYSPTLAGFVSQASLPEPELIRQLSLAAG